MEYFVEHSNVTKNKTCDRCGKKRKLYKHELLYTQHDELEVCILCKINFLEDIMEYINEIQHTGLNVVPSDIIHFCKEFMESKKQLRFIYI